MEKMKSTPWAVASSSLATVGMEVSMEKTIGAQELERTQTKTSIFVGMGFQWEWRPLFGFGYDNKNEVVSNYATSNAMPRGCPRFGFIQSRADYSLFTKKAGQSFVALLVYVDDIVVTSNDAQSIINLKNFLDAIFKIKDLGSLKYFLDLEVARNSNGIQVCQCKYALDILHDSCLLGCKPSSTPMDSNLKLSNNEGTLLQDPTLYRRLIDKLIYLTITQPDLTYSTHLLSQYMATPYIPHLQAAYKVLKYVEKSLGHGLFFPSSSSCQVTAYCHSDWASCPDTRRSTTGCCVFLGQSLFPGNLRSKQQFQEV
ncbi:uncharacterized mitochondrial protein AtMg00810-like [Carya illinoinensis]|uniref:uncharacterized mitochondrial protein AtMg00810-like n=1 Tax=Carya illinoinensis TaxID=32201 RepID=UPI001C726B25|nr:uncharacterized mitochondrial protein AtMg00810-like [Carya illinoinensis]